MNGLVSTLIACIMMTAGHVIKTHRWKQYFKVYEEPHEGVLLRALSVGHTLNVLLPIRVGDVARAIIAGKKTKNGFSFSIATVIVDLYVDLLTVGLMFAGLFAIGKGGENAQLIGIKYAVIFAVLIPATVLAVVFKKQVKFVIKSIAAIFNDKLNFRLLYVSYLCILSLKDIIKKINKTKFLIYTALMWIVYCGSYWFFADALQRSGTYSTMSDVFVSLFSGAVIYKVNKETRTIWALYLCIPLFICLLISLIVRQTEQIAFIRVLPYLTQSDRFSFLKMYYENENRDYLNSYLQINQDVTIIEDKSKGSDASTILAIRQDGTMCYRKYAFGEAGNKLDEQVKWIEKHADIIPLPRVLNEKHGDNFISYDMPQVSGAESFFSYIHTMPTEKSFAVLMEIFDDLEEKVYSNRKEAETGDVTGYIANKVKKNIAAIFRKSATIRSLEQYDVIEANGTKLRTIHMYTDLLSEDNLLEVFSLDRRADIHGDLTVENVVCTSKEGKYYLIDPNGGNILNSPFLDYAKMLQSIHGNYEFYMMVENVVVDKNRVHFAFFPSEAYAKLYEEYKRYLSDRFNSDELKSIYYHEAVHWLRLLPYKIAKNEKTAVAFYVGLLNVLDSIRKIEDETKTSHI